MLETKSYVAMESSLNALWMKQKIHQNNIANFDTPGYKAKELDFEEILNKKTGTTSFVANINEDKSTSTRNDGNNVDMENENLELYKTYVQYSFLTRKISGTFKNTKYVLNQIGK